MSQDYLYEAGLDASQLYAELQKINAAMINLGKQGNDIFGQIGEKARKSGQELDRINNQASSLQQQFGQLGNVLQRIGGNTSIGQLGMAIGVVSGGVSGLTMKYLS